MDRRTLLKFGTAGVAMALAEGPAQAGSLFPDIRGLARAVFDERFAESRAFGQAMTGRGIEASGIRGDVASLWYHDLKANLLEQRRPVVGLTDRTALFCLEELARDVGMKVQGRIDHAFDPQGTVTHLAIGPAPWIAAGARLAPEPGYGRVMASLLADPTLHGGSPAAQKATGPYAARDRKQLVSWWIA